MQIIDLFSGIGGFSLAGRWAGWSTVQFCEIDGFCQKVLGYHFPGVPIHSDIKTLDGKAIKRRDEPTIVVGGFPCQPYSAAGKRLGKEDDRHLWPEMLRIIRDVSPDWVVGENVRGLTNWNGGVVFDEVQSDLESAGYEVLPFLLPACAVNAPHRRDRIWFVAHSIGSRHGGCAQKTGLDQSIGVGELVTDERHNGDKIRCETERCCRVASDPICGSDQLQTEGRMGMDGSLLEERKGGEETDGFGINCDDDHVTDSECGNMENKCDVEGCLGKEDSGWSSAGLKYGNIPTNWDSFPTTEPTIRSRNDGVSHRLVGITFPRWRKESIKAYGNAIVPQVAYQIFKAINEYEAINKF